MLESHLLPTASYNPTSPPSNACDHRLNVAGFHERLIMLARYLADSGRTAHQLAEAMEKPWHFDALLDHLNHAEAAGNDWRTAVELTEDWEDSQSRL